MAQKFIGKVLCSDLNGYYCAGIIAETEAYAGITDRASHAYGNRRTRRTEVMYMTGGHAYIYLCYGVHSLFNIVTNQSGMPDAILVRAIIPLEGTECMMQRLKKQDIKPDQRLDGPGIVSKAMGFHYTMSGTDLCGENIWIDDRNIDLRNYRIKTTPRIGVAYAGEDAALPYRFVLHTKEMPPAR